MHQEPVVQFHSDQIPSRSIPQFRTPIDDIAHVRQIIEKLINIKFREFTLTS